MEKTQKEMEDLEVSLFFKIEDMLKKKYKCELACKMDCAFIKHVTAKYLEAGSPRAINKWLAGQDFLSHFVCMTEPPVWYDHTGINHWPFHDGWPMIFFGQFPSKLIGTRSPEPYPISIMVFGYKEDYEGTGFWLRLTASHQRMDDDGESIEEHYRKENRRLRAMQRKAEKEAKKKAEREAAEKAPEE